MNWMMKSRLFSDQANLVNDVVVCLEISYLDSETDYREFLPRRTRGGKRPLGSVLNRSKAVQYATRAGVVLAVATLLALSWFSR